MTAGTRFLVVAADGRAATASRDAAPDAETLDDAAEGLDAVGLAGWLVRVDPAPDGATVLVPLRRLTATPGDWPAIESAYRARRAAGTGRGTL
ncbi:MAG: hypothetical protein INR65_12390 [Gluconacetobacter diazotrophicus]|nr:hypothetical protein [Gluconacetobacter diazotrophicus]